MDLILKSDNTRVRIPQTEQRIVRKQKVPEYKRTYINPTNRDEIAVNKRRAEEAERIRKEQENLHKSSHIWNFDITSPTRSPEDAKLRQSANTGILKGAFMGGTTAAGLAVSIPGTVAAAATGTVGDQVGKKLTEQVTDSHTLQVLGGMAGGMITGGLGWKGGRWLDRDGIITSTINRTNNPLQIARSVVKSIDPGRFNRYSKSWSRFKDFAKAKGDTHKTQAEIKRSQLNNDIIDRYSNKLESAATDSDLSKIANQVNREYLKIEQYPELAKNYLTDAQLKQFKLLPKTINEIRNSKLSHSNENSAREFYKKIIYDIQNNNKNVQRVVSILNPKDKVRVEKILNDNPTFTDYILQQYNKTGKMLNPLDQKTVNRFITTQETSFRGLHTTGDEKSAIKIATDNNLSSAEIKHKSGGDRLYTDGGTYSSQSNYLANKFARDIDQNPLSKSYVAVIKSNFDIPRNIPIEQQLQVLRKSVLPYSIYVRGKLSNDKLLKLGFKVKEALYVNGERPLFERGHIRGTNNNSIKKLTYLGENLSDARHRWGTGSVPTEGAFLPSKLGGSFSDRRIYVSMLENIPPGLNTPSKEILYPYLYQYSKKNYWTIESIKTLLGTSNKITNAPVRRYYQLNTEISNKLFDKGDAMRRLLRLSHIRRYK